MLTTILLTLALLLGGHNMSVASPSMNQYTEPEMVSATALQRTLRDMWTGHLFWIRSYVFASHHADLESAKTADAKTVENVRALTDVIAPFYGQETADQLFQLLSDHYGAVKD